jgi:hypothetical protein
MWVMSESEYIKDVQAILRAHTDEARSMLSRLPGRLPTKATAIELLVFVDQDGEGFLDVRVSLAGSESSVINKAIQDIAVLFETKMVDGDMVPALPLMDPFSAGFSVQDVLTDCAVDWLVEVWAGMNQSEFRLPATIFSAEGYGTKTPVELTA